jgi:hypothetical protein
MVQVSFHSLLRRLFTPTTFQRPSQRQFLLSSSIVWSLCLLGGIPMSLHLWHLPLLLQLLHCVVCPVAITPPLLLRTSLCLDGLLWLVQHLLFWTSLCLDGLLWRVQLLLLPSLPGCQLRPAPPLPLRLSLLLNPPYAKRNPLSFLRSKMPRVIWIFKISLSTIFVPISTALSVRMIFFLLTLSTLEQADIGKANLGLPSRMGGFTSFLRTMVPTSTGKASRCLLC